MPGAARWWPAAGLVVLACAATIVAGGAQASQGAPAIRTLASISGGQIRGFAQDGLRFATFERPRKDCGRARVVVRSGAGRVIARIIPASGCGGQARLFAFGGNRALWSHGAEGKDGNLQSWVYTAVIGDREARKLEHLFFDPYPPDKGGGGGRTVSDAAASGAIAVYGGLSWETSDGCSECHPIFTSGRVTRVGRPSTQIREAPPPLAVAVGARRIAVVAPTSRGCACNAAPAWSPDGSSLAYATRRDGFDWEVAIAAPAGPTVKVTDNWSNESSVGWSPDGSSLVYAREAGQSAPTRIVVSKRDGTDAHVIAYGDNPAWSPSGRIAFSKSEWGRSGIWLVKPDGSEERRLTSDDSDSDPSWSPDGTQLAFTRIADGDKKQVVVANADGSGVARVLAAGYEPTWSPDGQSLAYTAFASGDAELRIVGADGTGARSITNNAVDDYSPDWSPDGARIAFVRSAEGKAELYSISRQGGTETQLTTTKATNTWPPVEIRTAEGKLVSRIMPSTSPVEVALSGQLVAVLMKATLGPVLMKTTLGLYDPDTGRELGAASLPRHVASISVSGKTVVFATGRRIWVLDGVTNKRRVVATAAANPIGLSIEGRRIAWAENLKTSARIRAVFLP